MLKYGFTDNILHVVRSGRPICGCPEEVDLIFDDLPVAGTLCEPCTRLMSGQPAEAHFSRAGWARNRKAEEPWWHPLVANRRWLRRLLKLEKSYALSKMDWKLERYMGFSGGRFVEVGANDGVRQSNTLFFERYKDWQGVLIEADPQFIDACRKNRPKSKVVCAAVVPPDWEGPVVLRQAGLMSVVKGGMKTTDEEDGHVALGRKIQGMEPDEEEIVVDGRTLDDILDSCGLTSFDFLSLDVEGMEVAALRGLSYRPRYILVEARYRTEVDKYLSSRLYRPIAKLGYYDVLYQREEDFANLPCR